MNKSEKERLIEEILNETGRAIEDPWVDYNITNPDDGIKYYAMVGFNSVTLINDEDDEYQGGFGLNGKYIQDASRLIRDIENSAEEIRLKYADKGVKVSIGDFNVGCECGMSIYVWIPYQKQSVKEMESDKMIEKMCCNCKCAKETNFCYDSGSYFKPYLYCFKLDDLVAEDGSCNKWESYIC